MRLPTTALPVKGSFAAIIVQLIILFGGRGSANTIDCDPWLLLWSWVDTMVRYLVFIVFLLDWSCRCGVLLGRAGLADLAGCLPIDLHLPLQVLHFSVLIHLFLHSQLVFFALRETVVFKILVLVAIVCLGRSSCPSHAALVGPVLAAADACTGLIMDLIFVYLLNFNIPFANFVSLLM